MWSRDAKAWPMVDSSRHTHLIAFALCGPKLISNAKVSFTPVQGVDGVQALVRGPPILYHRDLKGSACCDYLTCKLMQVA